MSDRTIILRHGAIVEMGATQKIFGNPQHDYTKMLLTAVPELHKKWQHTALDPVAVAANGAAAAGASMNGKAATALSHATMLAPHRPVWFALGSGIRYTTSARCGRSLSDFSPCDQWGIG